MYSVLKSSPQIRSFIYWIVYFIMSTIIIYYSIEYLIISRIALLNTGTDLRKVDPKSYDDD